MTFAGPLPATTYASLADCQQAATIASGRRPDEGGRFPISNGALWYECLSKHVENWQPAR